MNTNMYSVGCVSSVSTLSKFDEIRKADQASAQRLAAEKHSSSSSEDDDEDECEGKRGKILQSALCPYTSHTGDERVRLCVKEAKQAQGLQDRF